MPTEANHLGVSRRSEDVLGEQPFIEADALGKLLDSLIGPLLEDPAPGGRTHICLEIVQLSVLEK